MGYSCAIILQCTIAIYVLFVIANMVSLGIGLYLFAITITTEVKYITRAVDKKLRSKRGKSIAKKRFIELIEWHATVKQLSKSELFFIYLISNIRFYFFP